MLGPLCSTDSRCGVVNKTPACIVIHYLALVIWIQLNKRVLMKYHLNKGDFSGAPTSIAPTSTYITRLHWAQTIGPWSMGEKYRKKNTPILNITKNNSPRSLRRGTTTSWWTVWGKYWVQMHPSLPPSFHPSIHLPFLYIHSSFPHPSIHTSHFHRRCVDCASYRLLFWPWLMYLSAGSAGALFRWTVKLLKALSQRADRRRIGWQQTMGCGRARERAARPSPVFWRRRRQTVSLINTGVRVCI